MEKRFSSFQLLSHVRLFATPWTAACQGSLSVTNTQSLLKLMSIKSVMPSNHLILCRPLLLLPSIFPSIRVFSNESVLRIRWPKYWSFSFSISLSKEYPTRKGWWCVILLICLKMSMGFGCFEVSGDLNIKTVLLESRGDNGAEAKLDWANEWNRFQTADVACIDTFQVAWLSERSRNIG